MTAQHPPEPNTATTPKPRNNVYLVCSAARSSVLDTPVTLVAGPASTGPPNSLVSSPYLPNLFALDHIHCLYASQAALQSNSYGISTITQPSPYSQVTPAALSATHVLQHVRCCRISLPAPASCSRTLQPTLVQATLDSATPSSGPRQSAAFKTCHS